MKRQASVLQAIIDNWKNVEKATESAKNSTGSSTKEYEKYLNSVEGKTNQVKSSFQALTAEFLTSDLTKSILDTTNAVIKLVDAMGGIPTTMALIAGGLTLGKNVGGTKCCSYNTPTPIYFLCEV